MIANIVPVGICVSIGTIAAWRWPQIIRLDRPKIGVRIVSACVAGLFAFVAGHASLIITTTHFWENSLPVVVSALFFCSILVREAIQCWAHKKDPIHVETDALAKENAELRQANEALRQRLPRFE